MKTATVIALLASGLAAQTLSAAEMYLVNLRGTCEMWGDLKPTIVRLNTANILEHHGAMMEPPVSGKDLRLVYRPDTDRISIVTTNGTVACDYLIFALPTTLSNSVDTLRERFAFVYSEASSISIGSALISERLVRDGEGTATRQSVNGTLHYTQPGTEETGPQVCAATFKTGKKIVFDPVTLPPDETPPAAP